MNLAKYDTVKKSDEGVWVPIFAPDDVTKVAEFRVIGRDSKAMKKRLQENAKKKQAKKNWTPIDEERMTNETLAAMVVDWRGVDDKGEYTDISDNDENGKEEKLECNRENILRLIEGYPWIFEQVLTYAQDRSVFLQD